MKKFLNKLTKKSFYLEFSTLDVPTAVEICESVRDYANTSGAQLEFISEKMPIKFNLDNKIYFTQRGTSRGGPTVYCIEE